MNLEQAAVTETDVEEAGAEAPAPDRPIDGSAAWPWLKDAGLLVFVAFFGASYFILRSIGFDDATGASGGAGAASGPIELSLQEFAIVGDLETSPAGATLHIVNDGTVDHNLVIPELGLRTEILAPGEETTVELGRVSVRTYSVFCDLPGHRESGMETDLVVRS